MIKMEWKRNSPYVGGAIGNISTMKKLLEFRADINIASNEMKLPSLTFPYRETALHYAAWTGQMVVYDFLIKQGVVHKLKNTDKKSNQLLRLQEEMTTNAW